MERYNIFGLIHKGLRASLHHTALQLQQTDFTLAEQTAAALEAVREIVTLFDAHAHKEDHFVLPAIEAFEPSVVAAFESEHEADEALGRELRDCVDRTEGASTLLEKLVSGRELSEAFIRFAVFNFEHMAKEEDLLNKILWRHYSDAEIMGISGAIMQSIEPWMQNLYMGWMLRGISVAEAIGWLKAVEKTAPPVVLETLLRKAEAVMTEDRFRSLAAAMAAGEKVAA